MWACIQSGGAGSARILHRTAGFTSFAETSFGVVRCVENEIEDRNESQGQRERSVISTKVLASGTVAATTTNKTHNLKHLFVGLIPDGQTYRDARGEGDFVHALKKRTPENVCSEPRGCEDGR